MPWYTKDLLTAICLEDFIDFSFVLVTFKSKDGLLEEDVTEIGYFLQLM